YDCDKVLLHSAHEVRDGSGVHRRMGMNDLDRGRQNGSVGVGGKVPRDYSLAVLRMIHQVKMISCEIYETDHAYQKLREWIAPVEALRYELCESLEPLSPCILSVENAHHAKHRLQTVVRLLDEIFTPGAIAADRWQCDRPTFLYIMSYSPGRDQLILLQRPGDIEHRCQVS